MSDVDMLDVDEQSTLAFRDRPKNCLLLQLPLELRRKIYSYSLTNETPITWPSPNLSARGLGVGLLRTCNQIYSETVEMLYEQNTLLFHHPSDCNMFQYVHNAGNSRKIRQILLHIRDRDVVSLW
jgi:hypothetical protein